MISIAEKLPVYHTWTLPCPVTKTMFGIAFHPIKGIDLGTRDYVFDLPGIYCSECDNKIVLLRFDYSKKLG